MTTTKFTAQNIVLIEDSKSDAELIIQILQLKKIAKNISWIKDGEEALEALNDGKLLTLSPQLILLDLKLPKIDGVKVLQTLKAHPKARLIPVVVFSSSDHDMDKTSSYQSGANSYVVKPVDYESFELAIEEVGLYWLIRNNPLRVS